MYNHSWPGNVRELKNVLIKAVMECQGSVIHTDCIESILHPKARRQAKSNDSDKLGEIQKTHIAGVMNETGWNISEAARRLGISRPTLRKRLKLYGIYKK